MLQSQRITPCLWFDDHAVEAVALYTAVVRNSKILRTTRYGVRWRDESGERTRIGLFD